MSSFVITTKDGPPDIFVEVGKPFAKDPYLMAGIFKAIFSISNELTDNPLQVVQAKGFTVKFRQLDNDYVLIVGSDRHVAGLELLLEQSKKIIEDGERFNLPHEQIEDEIKKMIISYFEQDSGTTETSSTENVPSIVPVALQRLPDSILTVIFWGLLTFRHFKFPATGSLDYDNYISSLLDFLGQPCCSNLDQTCSSSIRFVSEKGDFLLDEKEKLSPKDKMILKTNTIKRLLKLRKKSNPLELKSIISSSRATISLIDEMIADYPHLTEDQKHEIDKLRYSIGLDLEHYLVEYLKHKNYPYLDEFLMHAETMEWVNPWLH